MGTYLSTPVTDKCEESGESLDCPDVPCAWGVVDMQGWRKSMEDGHTAVTDIALVPADENAVPGADTDGGSGTPDASPDGDPAASSSSGNSNSSASDAKVFGVFDGHGGPEVARFCQLYIVSVLQLQPTWRGAILPTTADSPTIPPPEDQEAAGETPVGRALRDCFHSLDRMIDDPARRYDEGSLECCCHIMAVPSISYHKDGLGCPFSLHQWLTQSPFLFVSASVFFRGKTAFDCLMLSRRRCFAAKKHQPRDCSIA